MGVAAARLESPLPGTARANAEPERAATTPTRVVGKRMVGGLIRAVDFVIERGDGKVERSIRQAQPIYSGDERKVQTKETQREASEGGS